MGLGRSLWTGWGGGFGGGRGGDLGRVGGGLGGGGEEVLSLLSVDITVCGSFIIVALCGTLGVVSLFTSVCMC